MRTSPPAKESIKTQVVSGGRSGRLAKIVKGIIPAKQPVSEPPETGFKDLLLNGAPKIEDMMIPPREVSPASTMGIEFDD